MLDESEIITTANLQAFNTLALPASASRYLKIFDDRQIPLLAQQIPNFKSTPRFVLGGGSNIVLNGHFDGLVLHMSIPGKRLLREDSEAWYIRAGAGENWDSFVRWTLEHGYPGLENLSLIPGTVGASPIQNIGAYGAEVKDFFYCATAWDFERQSWVEFEHTACRFAYRDSLFKQEGWHLTGRMAITHVTFRLPKRWVANIAYGDIAQALGTQNIASPQAKDIARAVIAIRQRKLPDPAVTPNAGSFFHNPVVSAAKATELVAMFPNMPHYPQSKDEVKLAAGWLIEQAGWKGKFLGPVGMYEKQALILINQNGGCSKDVIATMTAVQDAVFSKFQVILRPEPIFFPSTLNQ